MSQKKDGQTSAYLYHGTAACAFCTGPIRRLDALFLNDEPVPLLANYWGANPDIFNPDTPIIFPFSGGTGRFYPGGANQPPDPVLNKYAAHPPYKKLCYLVLDNIECGQSGAMPNITAVITRPPDACASRRDCPGLSDAHWLRAGLSRVLHAAPVGTRLHPTVRPFVFAKPGAQPVFRRAQKPAPPQAVRRTLRRTGPFHARQG
jgi:hypothetical protein